MRCERSPTCWSQRTPVLRPGVQPTNTQPHTNLTQLGSFAVVSEVVCSGVVLGWGGGVVVCWGGLPGSRDTPPRYPSPCVAQAEFHLCARPAEDDIGVVNVAGGGPASQRTATSRTTDTSYRLQ